MLLILPPLPGDVHVPGLLVTLMVVSVMVTVFAAVFSLLAWLIFSEELKRWLIVTGISAAVAAGSILIVSGLQTQGREEIESALLQVEDEYTVEFATSNITTVITDLIEDRQSEPGITPVEDVIYLYAGELYSTDLEVLHSVRGSERSVNLFQVGDTGKVRPFDPAAGSPKAATVEAAD